MSRGVSSDANAAIFLAALQGISANPNFFGSAFQSSPEAAVEFARACVRAAYRRDTDSCPDWTGQGDHPATE